MRYRQRHQGSDVISKKRLNLVETTNDNENERKIFGRGRRLGGRTNSAQFTDRDCIT